MVFLVWILVVVCAVVAAVLNWRRQARRRAALIRLAEAFGFEYAATDIFDDRWEPFRLFGMGQARGIRNVVYGTIGGVEVRVFDYWYRRGADRDRGAGLALIAGAIGIATWIGLTRRFTCAVAALPASSPGMEVRPKGVQDRVTELVAPDVPLESDAFNRRFHVRCEDPRFAVALLDPRVMEVLLALPEPPTLAVSEDRMLLVTRELRPAAVIGLLHTAGSLARTVPHVLASLYPLRPGFRPQDATERKWPAPR